MREAVEHQIGLAWPIKVLCFEAMIAVPEFARLAVAGAMEYDAVSLLPGLNLSLADTQKQPLPEVLNGRDPIQLFAVDRGSLGP
jgi:hypothetical protein